MKNKFKKSVFLLSSLMMLSVGVGVVNGFNGNTVNVAEAAETVSTKYTFSNYSAGTQYAENEEHILDENVTVVTTQCHFTTQLRIYSSSSHDGYAIIKSTKDILGFGVNAGNKVDTIMIYGSNDEGASWTEYSSISVTSTSYNDYEADLPDDNYYKWLKLDVSGSNQVRITSMTLTTESSSELITKFDANGGTFDDSETIKNVTTAFGGTVEFPNNPTKDNCEFLGWYNRKINGEKIDSITSIESGSTLYACWDYEEVNGTKYSFDFTSANTDYADAGTTNVTINDVVNGAVSISFLKNDGYAQPFTDGVGVRVYAKSTFTISSSFAIKYVKFIYSTDDASYTNAIVSDSSSVETSTWLALSDMFSVTFTVDSTSGQRRFASIDVFVDDTVTTSTYTTTFDPNGGTINGSTIYEVSSIEDANVIFPVDPIKDGYIFDGWFDSTDTKVTSLVAIENATLTAKWIKVNTLSIDYSNFESFNYIEYNSVTANTTYNQISVAASASISSSSIGKIHSIVVDVYGNYENMVMYSGTSSEGTVVESSNVATSNGKCYTYLMNGANDFYFENPSTYTVSINSIVIYYEGEIYIPSETDLLEATQTKSSLGFSYVKTGEGESGSVSLVSNVTTSTYMESDSTTNYATMVGLSEDYSFVGISNGSNKTYIHNSGQIRLYTDNTIKLTIPEGDITSVEFTYSGTYIGTVSYEIEGNSVLISNTGSQARITEIKVSYEVGSVEYTFSDLRIRFNATVDSDVYNALNITKAGFEVSAEGWSKSMDIDCTEKFATDENGDYFIICSIWQIPEEAYGTVLTAKAYFEVDGVRYYAQETSYSVKTIAAAYLENSVYSTLTDNAKGAITAFNAQLA